MTVVLGARNERVRLGRGKDICDSVVTLDENTYTVHQNCGSGSQHTKTVECHENECTQSHLSNYSGHMQQGNSANVNFSLATCKYVSSAHAVDECKRRGAHKGLDCSRFDTTDTVLLCEGASRLDRNNVIALTEEVNLTTVPNADSSRYTSAVWHGSKLVYQSQMDFAQL